MRKTIRILAVVLAIVFQIHEKAHAQQHQPSKVVSVGGGPSAGGVYTHFSVVGGEAVQSSVSGGTYSGEAGFIFGTRVEYLIPVANDASVELNENTLNGTSVHTVTTIYSGNAALNYSIISGNEGGAFAINASTGAVTVADATQLDYETRQSFLLQVDVSDGTNSDDAFITITLNNLNDNIPVALDAALDINENSAAGTQVHTVAATDLDNEVLSYGIISGNESGAFAIDASTGLITVADATQLDYEKVTQFVLRVRVSDGLNTDDAVITVSLLNLDEHSPVAADAQTELNENSAVNSPVHTVAATDADGSRLSYSISAGNGSGAFAIDASTGLITVADASQLDYEKVTQFVLTVRVSDGVKTDDAVVTINLKNLNDNRPVVMNAQTELEENSAAGTVVTTVVATDADKDALSYSISSGNESGAFAINAATGAVTVTDSSKLDYETITQFVLTISVSDGVNAENALVTVNLVNIDDDPRFSISGNVITPEGKLLTNGTVALLEDENGTKVQVQNVSLNGEGKFLFQEIKGGSYTLKVIPPVKSEEALPLLSTFLGGTQLPAGATIFLLDKDVHFTDFSVLRELPAEEEWKGNSAVSGILVEEEKGSSEGGRIMKGLHTQAGTPMAGAQVFLTDPETKAVKFSEQTDAEGKFTFSNVASRKYGFSVEYQGKSFDMPQSIDLSTESSRVEVTAVVSEGGVNATVEQITGLEEVQNSGLVLYPNPVKDKLFIKKEDSSPGSVEICVYDSQGKVLSCTQSAAGAGVFFEEVDFSALPNGIYIISFRQAEKMFYRKIAKY